MFRLPSLLNKAGAQLSCSHLVDEEKGDAEKLCMAVTNWSQAQPTDLAAQMCPLQQQLQGKKNKPANDEGQE